ncbi:hypothetical protein EJ577_00200, partial [Pseudomonas aeruginosa]
FNWPWPDHFRVVTLPRVDDLEQAILRIGSFLKGYQQTPPPPAAPRAPPYPATHPWTCRSTTSTRTPLAASCFSTRRFRARPRSTSKT